MRRIKNKIFLIFLLFFSFSSYGADYCLFKKIPYGDGFSIHIFIKSSDCKFDDNSDSIIKLFYHNKPIKESKNIFPKIEYNNDYAFEGERDLRVNGNVLELELAKPNREMSNAYSFIFRFNINKDEILFSDYEISDLCYIPNEKLCPRISKLKENKDLHKIFKSLLSNRGLFDFNTIDIYNKIYRAWQGEGESYKISIDKAHLYISPGYA
ncbi:hypothetical protein [Rodentibacter genomosp. 2]|uniref:hypothetical protein n=1 Tax=Rodentibacter genomosp. 2 TaxID=1908266 RepID=UPI001FC91952